MESLTAVLDIGKSNTRLFLVAPEGDVIWSRARASAAIACPAFPGEPTPALALDIEGIEAWLLSELATCPHRERIRTILPIAHGAAMVLIGAHGKALLAPDYEAPYFERCRAEYETLRDPFAATFSPSLSAGLNLGRQIFTLQRLAPRFFAHVEMILTYPQYWAWRLSGVAASEITSLGCHTDLWLPAQNTFSHLAHTQGWAGYFPPLQPANHPLGVLSPQIAAATGLSPKCIVLCGIHDSNASYLAHLVSQPAGKIFTVVSSGTWCVIFAPGAAPARLREAEDMLCNLDAQGALVPTARFMAGREYAAIAGPEGSRITPTPEGLNSVLAAGALALPSFAPGGPFPHATGRLLAAAALPPEGRAALATLYCALMVDNRLERLGVSGDILIDGPLAANPLFARILKSLRPQADILPSPDKIGIIPAVLWLARAERPAHHPALFHCEALPNAADLRAYRDRWRNTAATLDRRAHSD
jgi:sugar (pentulose or hexulose) kinase